MGKGNFTEYFDGVPLRWSALVAAMTFRRHLVALPVKMNGNTMHDNYDALTITVKTSFNVRSKAVRHTASLDRSKFLE